MPLVPAAKGVIILTPIILAAGYAIYDSHPPFRNFVDEQWRRWQDFAEGHGWRERQEEPMSFGGSGLWDPAEGIGLRERDPDRTARRGGRRRSSAETVPKRDSPKTAETTATESAGAANLERRHPRAFDSEIHAEESAQLSEESLRGLDSATPGAANTRSAKGEVDSSSEWSRHGTDAIMTPTTEEGGSIFGDTAGDQYELDSATVQSDARSDTTETATDADMLSAVGSNTSDHEHVKERDDDEVSVASSWSEIGSEVSFDSTL